MQIVVNDMSCQHCVGSITAAVTALDPNAKVFCDLGTKVVRIDSHIEPGKVAEAISQAGYSTELKLA